MATPRIEPIPGPQTAGDDMQGAYRLGPPVDIDLPWRRQQLLNQKGQLPPPLRCGSTNICDMRTHLYTAAAYLARIHNRTPHPVEQRAPPTPSPPTLPSPNPKLKPKPSPHHEPLGPTKTRRAHLCTDTTTQKPLALATSSCQSRRHRSSHAW